MFSFLFHTTQNTTNNQVMQQFFHDNGYIVLSSITYGPKYSRMKQDNQLHHNLSCSCINSSCVDDDFMNWIPKTSGGSSLRHYSTNISHNIMKSLQQDICHYICYLGLEEGLCVHFCVNEHTDTRLSNRKASFCH